YEVLWDGDGSSPMSDENFEKLLAMKPGLCVYISGYQTFSSTQITQLEAAGITCKPVDGFTSVDDIEDTVNELATLLGDTSADGGTNAPEIAASYLDWCADIKEDLANIETSSEIVFIEDWDETAETEVTYESGSIVLDTGAAVIRVGTGFRPLNDCLGYANVTDYAAKPTAVTNLIMFYHSYFSSLKTWYNRYPDSGELVYISPVRGRLASPFDQQTVDLHFSNMSSGIGEMYVYFTDHSSEDDFAEQGRTVSFGAVPYLGYDSFTTVIVKDAQIGQSLKDSWSWQTNDTTYYGYGTAGFFTGGTELHAGADTENTYYSTILGVYDVIVNPTGLGDWVDGSAESILESVWVACQVQGYYTENKMKNIIVDFYSTFYGYDLSATELADILAGPAF
ncbi:MAG: hypothetical protein LUG44_08825, partial [Clostridiales bacterium]|nr:hypothetical protein [Clostridiales bacterium]